MPTIIRLLRAQYYEPPTEGLTQYHLSEQEIAGKYAEAENLGDAINTEFNEFVPLIAPDQSFLIFIAGGRARRLRPLSQP